MDINKLAIRTDKTYYRVEFMDFIEQHLSYIKNQGLALVSLTQAVSYRHEGNFYGILHELNISPNFHYVVMRVNDLLSSDAYDGTEITIKLPDFNVIESLKAQFQTLQKI